MKNLRTIVALAAVMICSTACNLKETVQTFTFSFTCIYQSSYPKEERDKRIKDVTDYLNETIDMDKTFQLTGTSSETIRESQEIYAEKLLKLDLKHLFSLMKEGEGVQIILQRAEKGGSIIVAVTPLICPNEKDKEKIE